MPRYVNEEGRGWGLGKWDVKNGWEAFSNIYKGITGTGKINLGWGGIVLDVIGEVTLEMPNDITNNVVEGLEGKYRTYNDNVTIMPDLLTVSGYVGTLSVIRDNSDGSYIKQAAKVVSVIGSLIPSSTATLAGVKTAIKQTAQTATFFVDLAENLRKLVTGEDVQQKALAYLTWLRQTQYPIHVDTPLGSFNQMMVKTMTITQPEDTEDYFKVTATFQKWRQTKTATYSSKNNLTFGSAKMGVIP